MKRFFAFLLILCALTALCACGSEKPVQPQETDTPSAVPVAPPMPDAPAPAPDAPDAPPPAPADGTNAPQPVVPVGGGPALQSSLPAPYFVMIPMGEEYTADFNGDGAAETVCVTLEPCEFGFSCLVTVNGEPFSVDWKDGALPTLMSYDLYEDYYAVTDLDKTDGLLELAIQDWGPSDDLTTQFFRIENGALRDLGTVEGFLWTFESNGGVHLDGYGVLQTPWRLHVLHTWYSKGRWELTEEGLTPTALPMYYAGQSWDLVTLLPLTAYPSYGGAPYPVPAETPYTLPAGTPLSLFGTDDAEWLFCYHPQTYETICLHLDPDAPYYLESPDGYVGGWDALDGLLFAD